MQPGAEAPAAFPLAAGSSTGPGAGGLAAVMVVNAVMTARMRGGSGAGVGSVDPSSVDHMRVDVGFSNFNAAVSGPIKVTVN